MWLDTGVSSLSYEQGGGHRGNTGIDVNNSSTGKIEGHGTVAKVEAAEPASAPNSVGDRRINDCDPHHEEHEIRSDLEPLDEGAGDKRRRNDGEHHLKNDEQQRGYARSGGYMVLTTFLALTSPP